MKKSMLSVSILAVLASLPLMASAQDIASQPEVSAVEAADLPEGGAADLPEGGAAELPSEELPPEALRSIPGLEQFTGIAGMDAWRDPQSGLFWMRGEGDVIIAGWAFDEAGNSLNPLHEGMSGMTLGGLIENSFEQETVTIPPSSAPQVEAALASLPEAERKAAIGELIANLRGVEGEEAYNAAVKTWLEGFPDAPEPEGQESGAADAAPAVESGAEVESGASEGPGPEVGADLAETAATEEITLIDALGSSYQLMAGTEGAADIWMITDPSCDDCKAAIRALTPAIDAGDLRLHIVPLAAVDEDSFGILAGILETDDPVAAIRAMSIEGAEAPYARFTSLDEEAMKGLRTNQAIAMAAELPGLPFFAFETAEGPGYVHGPATQEDLKDAIPVIAEPTEEAPLPEPETANEEAPALDAVGDDAAAD